MRREDPVAVWFGRDRRCHPFNQLIDHRIEEEGDNRHEIVVRPSDCATHDGARPVLGFGRVEEPLESLGVPEVVGEVRVGAGSFSADAGAPRARGRLWEASSANTACGFATSASTCEKISAS
jgi:hypothetical protein